MNLAEYTHALRRYRKADPRATKEEKDAARDAWQEIKRNARYSPAHALAHLQWQDQRQQAAREATPTPKQL